MLPTSIVAGIQALRLSWSSTLPRNWESPSPSFWLLLPLSSAAFRPACGGLSLTRGSSDHLGVTASKHAVGPVSHPALANCCGRGSRAGGVDQVQWRVGHNSEQACKCPTSDLAPPDPRDEHRHGRGRGWPPVERPPTRAPSRTRRRCSSHPAHSAPYREAINSVSRAVMSSAFLASPSNSNSTNRPHL